MKVLWLYRFEIIYDFDNWLHMRFALTINEQPDMEVIAYGPHLKRKYPKITPLEFNEKLTIKDLYEVFEFDVIICCTKSRMFLRYNPKIEEVYQDWLPSDFSDWKKTPKIVLEEDYHYEKDDSWYQERGIDLILQRHYSQSLRENKVPMKFLPFSVDTNIFNTTSKTFKDEYTTEVCKHKPNDFNTWSHAKQAGWYSRSVAQGSQAIQVSFEPLRKPYFCFVGNKGAPVYIYRRGAVNKLLKEQLVESHEQIWGAKYVKILREYTGYVSGGSTMEICASKNFEIMASGGILLTNKFVGIEKLFPEGSYLSYKNNFSDIVNKAYQVTNDLVKYLDMSAKGQQVIKERHTHQIRIQELKEIIQKL